MEKLDKRLFKILKFSFFQILFFALSVSVIYANNLIGQKVLKQKISIDLEKVAIKDALHTIESSSDVYFTYRPSLIKDLPSISLKIQNEPLSKILNQLLLPLKIQYQLYEGDNLVLSKLVVDRTVSGTVTDNKGIPLIGANVLVKGTSVGTITDVDGNFSLDVPEGATTLEITYAGYTDMDVDISTTSQVLVTLTEGVALDQVTVLGSRGKSRTNVDRPVPIDIISTAELNATGQTDIAQSLHYTAPSFSAVKFGINDLAPLIDPATLRGLAPDQTLLLVNGKRRHKVSFFSLNHGVGKGQLGNDINAIPSAAVKRVEILRDGAAAQYGSDAMAGVMNMQLNDASEGGSIRFYSGTAYTQPKYDDLGSNADLSGQNIYGDDYISDGKTFTASANFGLKWGEEGYLNTTLKYHTNEAYDRSGFYTHGAGWYPDDPDLTDAENQAADDQLRKINGIDYDRAVLGAAENTNYGIFINAGRPINDVWDFYTFGGYTNKEVIGGIFSRAAARTDRSALDIFPNGFNPETPSILTDHQMVAGVKGDLGAGWNIDLSLQNSANNLDLYNRNTVNPSLGSASPTQFYTGSLNVSQTVFNVDASKSFGNTTLALGLERRHETFTQSQGQVESWVAGPLATKGKDVGSTGREGYSDRTDGSWDRNNTGFYAEVESDITDAFLLGAAVRLENYSDFGSDLSYKVASRYKLTDKIGVRGSVNRSFRAPSLAQLHYSNFAQIAFDDEGNSVVTPFLPIRDALVQEAFGITELQPETSFDIALGVTAELSPRFTITADVYQISIEDRIIVSGGIPAAGFSQFDGAGYDEINIFTNAVNTTTQGLDFVADYKHTFNNSNRLNLTLAANFNKTKVDDFNLPAAFENRQDDLIDDRDIVFLTDGIPNQKIIFSLGYNMGKTGIRLRATNFGQVIDAREGDDTTESGFQEFSPKTIVDLSFSYQLTNGLSLSAGVNNLLDTYPDMLLSPNVRGEVIYSRRTNQFGTQGRFLNFSLNYQWK